MKKIFYLLFSVVLFTSCSVEPIDELEQQNALLDQEANSQNGNPHQYFDIPVLEPLSAEENSLQVKIIAGESGATGGLSVRWMTWEEYSEYDWNNDLAGHVLLNGHANENYSLEPGEEFVFSLENYVSGEGPSWNRALECGQKYVFIVQAHQDGKIQKSEYSEPEIFSTAACDSCDLLEDQYSTTFSYPYLDKQIDDVGQIYDFLLSELSSSDATIPEGGTFSLSALEILRTVSRWYAAGEESLELSVEYLLETEECSDSTVFNLTISRN